MSRGFVREGDQEEVPIVLPRAFLPLGTPNYVTPEGLRLLHEEMETLKKERVEAGTNYVVKNFVDAKMRLLSERINSAALVDITKTDPDIVSFGKYVKFNDKIIRIVGVDEANASRGLISFISPIAKSLIGKKKGDKFEIETPRGTEIVEVQDVMLTCIMPKSIELVVKGKDKKPKEKIVKTEINKCEKRESEILNTSDPQVHNISDSSERVFVPETNPTDFLPLINERNNIIGRALYCEIHNGNKVLHPAVHLLVYNSNKEIVARYWWHVAFGETAEKTLKRKMNDVGLQNIKPKFKKEYTREDKNEKELVYVYTMTYEDEVVPVPEGKDYQRIFEKD